MEEPEVEQFLRRVRTMQWVLWAEFGTDALTQRPCVAVQMWTLANQDLTAQVQQIHDSVFTDKSISLVLFSHEGKGEIVLPQQEQDAISMHWWIEHERSVACAFNTYQELFGAFCSKGHDGNPRLCFIVRCKRFIRLGEVPYPNEFKNIRVDLVEGSCAQLIGTNAHLMSFHPPNPPGFVGASIGNKKGFGSLGAVLTTEADDVFALTASHCLKDVETYGFYCPCPTDFPAAGVVLNPEYLTEETDEVVIGDFTVTLDAAVLSANNGQRFKARTNEADETIYFQSGKFLSLQETLGENLSLAVFGRTCGARFDLQLARNVTLAHVRAVAAVPGVFDVQLRRFYQNQLLVQSAQAVSPVNGGDSGSVCWKVNADNSLDAVGLVVCELRDNAEPKFGVVTPMEAVIQHLKNFYPDLQFDTYGGSDDDEE